MNKDVRAALERAYREHKTYRATGEALGVSGAHIHDLLHNRREPGAKLLRRLGFRKVIAPLYERIS